MRPALQRRVSPAGRRRQQGIALVIALVLLVIMSLVGLNGLRSVTLEERMTAHTYDRSLSFQATEAALRDAEEFVETTKPAPANGCNQGVCAPPSPTATPRWLDPNFDSWRSANAVDSGSVTITPEYFVEYLGNTFECYPGSGVLMTCRRYRITARSNAGDDRAAVMLQSIYATD
jgi:type IV pilus assembly protein PilX